MAATKPECLKSTIELEALSLGDWIELARAQGHKPISAWYRFVEHSQVDLAALTMEEWEAITSELEVSEGWAYVRYKESRKA